MKAAGDLTKKTAPPRWVLATRPFGGGAVEQALFLQRTIGNQAVLRLLSQRGSDRGSRPQPSPLAATPLPSAIQAKLVVGPVDDPLEHEADRVADQVVRMVDPVPSISVAPPGINQKCAACEEEEKAQAVQRNLAPSTAVSTREAPAGVHQTLRSSGQPLDVHTRTYFEDRFGYDFSSVRVHTDGGAAASAASIGAAAYTAGADIAFAADRFGPATFEGRRLLAHELTHVVQQSASDRPGASSQSTTVRCQGESDPFRAEITARWPGDSPVHAPPGALAWCKTKFTKAGSFQDLINLVRAAEAALAAAGITSPKDQIHAIRGIFYGTVWSLDYSVERSTTRNEGFQRFTRPSENVATSTPPDVRTALSCGLFDALKDSQDLIDPSGRQVDFGHLIIGLDAREDPTFASNIKYPVQLPIGSIDVDLGGTGTELVTWIGDLGGGAANLATRRATAPTVTATVVFSGSDYGGSINLEGDVAGSVVATSSTTSVTAPNIAAGKQLSDALQDYISPAAPSAAWTTRAKTFLTMNGGTVDATGVLTNRAALIAKFAPKIQEFACNYLASRVKDKHITFDQAKAAADHVIPCAQEVATAFVDALEDSSKTGGKIEAKRFPAASPPSPGACTKQILAGKGASMLGL
jgi:hypothetical protein